MVGRMARAFHQLGTEPTIEKFVDSMRQNETGRRGRRWMVVDGMWKFIALRV